MNDTKGSIAAEDALANADNTSTRSNEVSPKKVEDSRIVPDRLQVLFEEHGVRIYYPSYSQN